MMLFWQQLFIGFLVYSFTKLYFNYEKITYSYHVNNIPQYHKLYRTPKKFGPPL